MMDFDFLVIGNSIAGYGAAITLAKAEKTVGVIELLDENPIRGMWLINPTPFNENEIDGSCLDEILEKKISNLGIINLASDQFTIQCNNNSLISIVFNSEMSHSTKCIIYAPNGMNPKLPLFIEKSKECFGMGLSFCAWSDSFLYTGEDVCVIGEGYWAFDQIQWCNQYASSVTLLCDKSKYGVGPYTMERVRSIIGTMPVTNLTMESIQYMSKDECVVNFFHNGHKQKMVFSGVFWAPERVVSWECLDGEDNARSLMKNHRLYCAGLVAGINAWDHNEQWKNGVKVAETCLIT